MSRSQIDTVPKNNTITPISIKPNCVFDSWATKQGGKHKSWKKRYFMLVHAPSTTMAELYYFKNEKAKSATGVIKINERSTVRDVKEDKKNLLSIDTGINIGKRSTYLLFCATQQEQDKFKKALTDKIASLKQKKDASLSTPGGGDNSSGSATAGGTGTTGVGMAGQAKSPADAAIAAKSAGSNDSGVRAALDRAKNAIPFLTSTDSDKTLEFFQIWTESIPPAAPEVSATLVMTADMTQLSWRVYGPQNVLIQEMVDFFWNVGAPEQEIDRLNEVGGLINPLTIGSWIDMSTKGGMDGGWVFPVQVSVADALKACDEGQCVSKLTDWCRQHNIFECVTVGRDMGASPPRQTEVRFVLPGSNSFEGRYAMATEACKSFGFPQLPSQIESVIREWNPPSMELSVITSSEGFVRLGMILPSPDETVVNHLCNNVGADSRNIENFQNNMNIKKPSFVELQYLMQSFGYGVYNEGLNVVFHYNFSFD